MGFAKIRNQTAAEWTAENPILEVDEIGREFDLNGASQAGNLKWKIGDGVTRWASLGYALDPAVITDLDTAEAAIALKAPLSPTIRETTAATDTITQADNGKVISANRATGQTLTVTGPISAGFNCIVIQEGAGQTTFAAGGGATVSNRQTHTKIAGQHGIASLISIVADAVKLGGDTAV